VSEAEEFVPAGVGAPGQTVGLNGLVPFDVLQAPAVVLRPGAGVLRLHIELPAGVGSQAGAPLACRLNGWAAGMMFAADGRIQSIPDPKTPVELPYEIRTYPAPPAAGELVVDISFWYVKDGSVGIQDVQWRQRITWGDPGQNAVDLHYALTI
jgi:hypothetical protein